MPADDSRASTPRKIAARASGTPFVDLPRDPLVTSGRPRQLVPRSRSGLARDRRLGGVVSSPATVTSRVRGHLPAPAGSYLRRLLYVRAHAARQLGQGRVPPHAQSL